MSSKFLFAVITGAGVVVGATMACWCYCEDKEEKSQTENKPAQNINSPSNAHQSSSIQSNEFNMEISIQRGDV